MFGTSENDARTSIALRWQLCYPSSFINIPYSVYYVDVALTDELHYTTVQRFIKFKFCMKHIVWCIRDSLFNRLHTKALVEVTGYTFLLEFYFLIYV